MPARILFQTAQGKPESFPITDEVMRLGSDRSCGIRIEGLPAHLLTVQFREGRYLVLNRSRQVLHLGKQVLPPGANATWAPKQKMRIGGGMQLTLETADDPRPTAESTEVFCDGELDPATRYKQLGLIGACFLLIVLMLLSPDPEPEHVQVAKSFEQLVNVLLEVPHGDHRVLTNLRTDLQTARYLERRGALATAESGYRQLRDQLSRLSSTAVPPAVRDSLLGFVKERIAGLSRQ